MIKRETQGLLFCGPAALCLITGLSDVESLDILKRITGRKVIRGLSFREMERAFWAAGYHSVPCPSFGGNPKVYTRNMNYWNGMSITETVVRTGKATLATWIRKTGKRDPEQWYFINTTGHFIALKGRKIYDNSHPDGVFLRKYKHRRISVWAASRIVRRVKG